MCAAQKVIKADRVAKRKHITYPKALEELGIVKSSKKGSKKKSKGKKSSKKTSKGKGKKSSSAKRRRSIREERIYRKALAIFRGYGGYTQGGRYIPGEGAPKFGDVLTGVRAEFRERDAERKAQKAKKPKEHPPGPLNPIYIGGGRIRS